MGRTAVSGCQEGAGGTLGAMDRRQFLLRAASALAAVTGSRWIAGSARRAFAQAGTRIRVSTLRGNPVSWLWAPADIAQILGYFESEGLDHEFINTGRGENTPALISGAGEFQLSSPINPMKAALQGQKVLVFAGLMNKYNTHVVITRRAANRAGVNEQSSFADKAAALRGLRIATQGPGSPADLILRYILERAGYDPDRTTQLVTITGGAPTFIAALEQGQIDGFALSSPTAELAVLRFDCMFLFNMAEDPMPELADFLYIVTSTTERFAAQNPDAVYRYTRALTRALRFIQEEKDQFQELMREVMKDFEPELVDVSFPLNYPGYMKHPAPTEHHFALNKEFLQKAVVLTGGREDVASLTYEQVFTRRFADAAANDLGIS